MDEKGKMQKKVMQFLHQIMGMMQNTFRKLTL
nr:MAG TPA_asm: hypothetical protein [Caudoviricetes sp.]DAZ43564.1 MAG TPA: hypothetical protein [Caudoviricetes sp.]